MGQALPNAGLFNRSRRRWHPHVAEDRPTVAGRAAGHGNNGRDNAQSHAKPPHNHAPITFHLIDQTLNPSGSCLSSEFG